MIEHTLKDYLDELKSSAPAPGGGSASALAGAQGVALVMMVANLTVGREKYKEQEALCQQSLKEGAIVMEGLIQAIHEDTQAYNQVMAAYQLPKETEEEKALRSKAIREATLVATQVPYDAMKLSVKGLELAKSLVGKSNPNCSSDLGVAALNLLACGQGVWLNILTNLSGIKDPEREQSFRDGGMKLYQQTETLAHEIYEEVKNGLKY